MSDYKPTAELKVKIREYEDKETKKMKGVWQTVGTLWSTPHGSSQFVTLDAIPVNTFKDGERVPFDGRISVFKREENKIIQTADDIIENSKDVVIEDIDDKPIDLSEIQF